MTLIQELIKHFVLGIVSVLICSIAMAEINQTKDFIKAIENKGAEVIALFVIFNYGIFGNHFE